MRWWLVVLTGLGLLSSFASVALALSISNFIAALAHRENFELGFLWWFGVGLALKVTLPWVQERISATVSAKVKKKFRSELLSTNFTDGRASSAEVTLLATRGLDALDSYFGKFLPQYVYTLVVTPLVVALFFFVDPLSSIILIFTIPLIPLFMVLIGLSTKSEQDRQLNDLGRLSSHFAEVVRGISTLKLFGRIDHQKMVLAEIGQTLRIRTMKVLRISFLSGFALELAASLSVALLAVTIGFRLLDGQIAFATAMFLLILAPDAYLPIRMIGANYHASTEGIAAAKKILDLLDAPVGRRSEAPLPKPGLEVWVGESGSGKTRRMDELVSGANLSKVSWMPQEPGLFPGTVQQNIVGFDGADIEALNWAVTQACLGEVQLSHEVDDFGRGLSGGQSQRVALARALYRLRVKNLDHLFLDEPTAAVDSDNGKNIWKNLSKLADSGKSVTVITHQIDFLDRADRIVYV